MQGTAVRSEQLKCQEQRCEGSEVRSERTGSVSWKVLLTTAKTAGFICSEIRAILSILFFSQLNSLVPGLGRSTWHTINPYESPWGVRPLASCYRWGRRLRRGKHELIAQAQKSLTPYPPSVLDYLSHRASNSPTYFLVIQRRRSCQDPCEDKHRLKRGTHKPSNARSLERDVESPSGRKLPCQHLDFGLLTSRTIERINSCCFQPPVSR